MELIKHSIKLIEHSIILIANALTPGASSYNNHGKVNNSNISRRVSSIIEEA